MEVRATGILCLLIIVLNIGKERFIGNIALTSFFKIALMSVKNDFYNSLAKQNYIFINIIIVVIIVIIITIIFIITIITIIIIFIIFIINALL